MTLLLPSLAIVVGFVVLVYGADRFVAGAASLAHNGGVSPLVIGLTIVGFGTSAPELLVSSVAAARGAADLGVGNAIGSNVTNVALVLGLATLVAPLRVASDVLRRDLPLLFGAMALAAWTLLDGELGRVEGAILLGALLLYLAWLIRSGLKERREPDPLPDGMSTRAALFWVIAGLGLLLGSSELLVWGAKEVALAFGVEPRVVGLTVVALGTSLPELAATVAAARRDEHDIAVGNVMGSNLFNVLGVMGLPGMIAPGAVHGEVLRFDVPVMVGVTLVFFAFVALPVRHVVHRWQGAVLVALYAAYLAALFTGFVPPLPWPS
ncbi:MAG: calcium/sodium antiporter [Myxococcales bacterium]|nr:calcium/sodium antiporter [Myxococcales bacterium]